MGYHEINDKIKAHGYRPRPVSDDSSIEDRISAAAAEARGAAKERERIVDIIKAYSKAGLIRGVTNSLIDAINKEPINE
jgi:hypothetical protein